MSRGVPVSVVGRDMKGWQKKGKGRKLPPDKKNKPKRMVEIVHSGPSPWPGPRGSPVRFVVSASRDTAWRLVSSI